MARYDYDLFTIGAGSGGVRASRMSASYGARVAVAEERRLGGTCVNVGCIPKKLLVYASHFSEDFEDAHPFGWTVGERTFDWATLIENKDREIARLNGVYRRILDDHEVEVFEERAVVVDPHTVEVAGKRITAEHILIATGSWPRMPEGPGAELAISSNEMFHLKRQPKRALVVGGGYIAVEFAGILHGMGSQVTLIYRGACFLRGFDDDVRSTLAAEMKKKGIDLRFERRLDEIERTGADGSLRVKLDDGSVLDVDQVLCAIGRVPLTAGIGLEEAGVKLAPQGAIVVDEYSRSSVPSIHAIGDVTDRINLTPVAIHEGMCLAATLFRGNPTAPDHENVASAVFSQPSIATVGLTEAKARERHGQVRVYRTRFRSLKHAVTGRDEITMMKLVVDAATDRVVGAHMVGSEAAEIVQGFAVAVKAGATKAMFDATLGIHPTAAEEFVIMRDPLAPPEENG
ncbi:MAG: glutathione-disulfide reductase [Deltaproteobacteria bacterium]|nr:glutathione-disulfide reductase [Deltaproteobacteria bacterium]